MSTLPMDASCRRTGMVMSGNAVPGSTGYEPVWCSSPSTRAVVHDQSLS